MSALIFLVCCIIGGLIARRVINLLRRIHA